MRTNLYCIIDSQSGLMTGNFVPAVNDVVALLGFSQYVKKQKEESGVDPRCFRLKKCGEFEEDGTLFPDSKIIVRGDKAEELYGQLLEQAIEDDEDIGV